MLHLIDQKKIRKVGGVKELDANISIIAATNKDLKKEVQEQRFREDLYYRLNVIPIFLPPLRERREDIVGLVNYFTAHFNRKFKKTITGATPQVMEMLKLYDWPGNVRELKNVIERAMILNKGTQIAAENLPSELECHCTLKDSSSVSGQTSSSSSLPQCLVGIPLDEIEKASVLLALKASHGNQSQAARLLDIGRDALRYKMQKFGLKPTENHQDAGENMPSKSSP